MSNDNRKRVWRDELRRRRRAIAPAIADKAANAVCRHLLESQHWARAGHIGIYLANDGELNPQPIADHAHKNGKCVYLPRISGQSLQFAPWSPGDSLPKNRYGIGEPITEATPLTALDLILMPLVGFSSMGFRLGMGGGFYDRLLQNPGKHKALRLGLAYKCQQEDALESLQESWDIKLDGVITEAGLSEFLTLFDDPSLQG